MKKSLIIAAALALIGAGAALIYADRRLGMPLQTAITLASVYGALGFASLGILDRDWRSALVMALYGVMIGALGPIITVAIVAIPAFLFLLGALLEGRLKKPKEKETEKPDVVLPGSGILLKTFDAVYFQLFCGAEQIYLIAFGSVDYHFNPARAIRSEDEYQKAEGDLTFKPSDIRAINLYPDGSLRILTDKSLIKRARQDERFVIMSPMTADEVCQYLAGFPVNVRRVPTYQPSEEVARTVRSIFSVLSFAGALCAAVWMHTDEPGRLLVGLSVLFPMLAFALYCVFGYAMPKTRKNLSWKIASSVWYFSTLPLIFHFERDFNFDSLTQGIPAFLVLAGCMLLLFYTFNVRKRPKNVLNLIAGILMFCGYAVGQLNYALDSGSRVFVRPGIVASQAASDDAAPFDAYYLFVDADDGHHFLKVSREIYDAVEEGDTVTVQTHTGPLGIDYTDVVLQAEGEGQ